MIKILKSFCIEIVFIELSASLNKRKERNKLPERIAVKPSKADTEYTEKQLLKLNMVLKKSKTNTNNYNEILKYGYHFQVNTTYNKPEDVCNAIVDAISAL